MQKTYAAAIVVLLLASSVWAQVTSARPTAPPRIASDDLVAVELSTVGVDGRSGSPIVLLREPDSGSVVPIWVGVAEAQAIAIALHGVELPRPMTHDLMASLLSTLDATVEEVIVHDLRDSTYLGAIRLRLSGGDTVRDVDSRPSDALALALRTGSPIRVARKILVASPDFDFIAPEGPDQIVQLMGITVVAPTPELRREFSLGDREGLVVTNVAGRARDRGLRRGDLLVSVNGRAMREPMEFFTAVRATPAGAPVRITYVRAGAEHDIELPADLPPPRTPGRGVQL